MNVTVGGDSNVSGDVYMHLGAEAEKPAPLRYKFVQRHDPDEWYLLPEDYWTDYEQEGSFEEGRRNDFWLNVRRYLCNDPSNYSFERPKACQ